MFSWFNAYTLTDCLNKVRTKLKSTWLIPFPDNVILLNIKKTFNIEQNWKLKAKDTETWKTKTQKDEKLVLPMNS